MKARALARSQDSNCTIAARAAPHPAAFVTRFFGIFTVTCKSLVCHLLKPPVSMFKPFWVHLAFKPTPPLQFPSIGSPPSSVIVFPPFSFSCVSLALFSFSLHFTAPLSCPTHLLHPSAPAQLAKRQMSGRGLRLSRLSHAICEVKLRHGVTFSTLLFPSSRDSEPRGIDRDAGRGLDPQGEVV